MQARLVLGDTLNFPTTVAGYSAADGWVLKFVLVPRAAGPAPITLTSTADGEQHRVQVGATTTAAWTAGAYSWHSWVEKASEKYSVSSGSITLQADPRSAATSDLRSQAQVALEAARAALAAWTPTQRSYTIAGRSMTFNSTADILPIVRYWEQQVAREARAEAASKGLDNGRRVFLRLGRA
jgi:enamine deaminase RidA (YjgF/YER057c/UK114 family)